jgi:ABC-type Fe3+-hydroxamate transport system substrate-binding protein
MSLKPVARESLLPAFKRGGTAASCGLVFLAIALSVIVGGCSRPVGETGTLPAGENPEVLSSRPRRVVSLSPQITESLHVLSADESLVGITTLCRLFPGAGGVARVGTPLRPDVEKIVILKPDLVLASREGNPPWAVERLRRLGIPTQYFERPKSLQALFENFVLLARLLGKEEEGRKLVRAVTARMEQEERKGSTTVFWQVGADPLVAASTYTFADDLIRAAGGVNVVKGPVPYPRINKEEIILLQPKIIVLTDMGYNIPAVMRGWQGCLHGTRFAILDAYAIGSPTPLSALEAVRTLSSVIREGS